MKSERAKEYLKSNGRDHFGVHPQDTAYFPDQVEHAIDIAEEDTEVRIREEDRVRALEALCKTMKLADFHCEDCPGIEECFTTQEYLKCYDDEK
jgi:hypothetical protein